MNIPPPLPAKNIPPPLPKGHSANLDAYRTKAIWASIFGAFLFTGASVKITLSDGRPLDLKVFAVCLAIAVWIGLFGLISRKKILAWGAYVTFAAMLIGFPLGTVLGLYGIKWMRAIYPKFN